VIGTEVGEQRIEDVFVVTVPLLDLHFVNVLKELLHVMTVVPLVEHVREEVIETDQEAENRTEDHSNRRKSVH